MSAAKVIVLGNEKGGSGKSTTAMHLTVALLRQGLKVGSLDLDARQGSFSRYLENRQAFMASNGVQLPMPDHFRLLRAEHDSRAAAEADERKRFSQALQQLGDKDFIIADTPGADTHLARLAHQRGDILITPLNDSFLDLDLLARVDPEGRKVIGPSVYSQMVWEQRQARARSGGQPIDWIVLRNRLSQVDAHNKRRIESLLTMLAKRIGFRLGPGFGERVIFRELFTKGLTLLDLADSGQKLSLSHVAARQEVRALLDALNLGVP